MFQLRIVSIGIPTLRGIETSTLLEQVRSQDKVKVRNQRVKPTDSDLSLDYPDRQVRRHFLNSSHVDFSNVCYVPYGYRQPSTVCMIRCYWTTAHLAKYRPFGLSQECLTRNAVLLQWGQSSEGRRKDPLSEKVEMIRCYLKLPSFVSRGQRNPWRLSISFFS